MSGVPVSFDPKGVLIDKLGESPEKFEISNLYIPKKGLTAIFEIRKLKAELLDFAKDPTIDEDELGIPRPKEPNLDNLQDDEKMERIEVYRKTMQEYHLAITSLRMKVPIPDMFAIEQYMEPFEATIHATPAVKGRRFHAFTKNIEEPQQGLFGLGKKRGGDG